MTADPNSLNNFYQIIKARYPTLAAVISEDIITIALYGLGDDKRPAQEALERLRRRTQDLSEVHRRMMEDALIELGYSPIPTEQ